MPRAELSLVLVLLRTVRGWKQSDLSRASRVRYNSISLFERGKQVPDAGTLRQLVTAMGYRPEAVEQARAFIAALRGEPAPPSAAAAVMPATARGQQPAGAGGAAAGDPGAEERAAAIEREVSQFGADVETAVARLSRLLLDLSRREG